MSALGQKQTCAPHSPMSALPPIATAKADSRKGSCLLCPRKRTCAMHLPMSTLVKSVACTEGEEAELKRRTGSLWTVALLPDDMTTSAAKGSAFRLRLYIIPFAGGNIDEGHTLPRCIERVLAHRRTHTGSGAGLAFAQRHSYRASSGRRRERYRRARGLRAGWKTGWTYLRGREPARCRRHYRRQYGRQGRARWSYHFGLGFDCSGERALYETALRHA